MSYNFIFVTSTYSRDGMNQMHPHESINTLINSCNRKRCPATMKGHAKSTCERKEATQKTPFP